MIAILGRGIQLLRENGPWVLTEDLELCDKDSAHLPVRAPVNDESPYCMIGGGEMNLEAGHILIQRYEPKLVVCAYGGRSKYLESVNGPSESEVMSGLLDKSFRDGAGRWSSMTNQPEIAVWERTRQLPVPSNTRQELLNIFDLALERNLRRIAMVTVGVHVPRTATYKAKHLSVYEQYRELSPVVFESEEVLLGAPGHQSLQAERTARVDTIRKSKSFARNWEREALGISKIVRDVYGDAKPKVVAV
jgi:hypothetical protein